jgi:hypothetical protein
MMAPKKATPDDRLRGLALYEDERQDSRCANAEETQHLPGAPRVFLAAEGQGEEDGNDPDQEGEGAPPVDDDLALELRLQRGHLQEDEQQRHQADGHVHVEDPTPGEVVREEPAQPGTDDARDAEHGAEYALVLAALGRAENVRHDRERRGEDSRAPQALEGPERDQLAHAARLARKNRSGEEKHHADEHHDLAAVEVGELAIDGDHRGGGQQVCGHHPGIKAQAIEVLEDLRHCGCHDGLVERAEQQRHHDPDQREGPLSRGNGIHERAISFAS